MLIFKRFLTSFGMTKYGRNIRGRSGDLYTTICFLSFFLSQIAASSPLLPRLFMSFRNEAYKGGEMRNPLLYTEYY